MRTTMPCVAIAVMAGLVGGCVSIGHRAEYEQERPISIQHHAKDVSRIEIDIDAGEVEVLQEDGDEIRVEGWLRARGHDAERLRRRLDEAEIIVDEGSTYRVSIPKRRFPHFEAELVITTPRELELDVNLNYGRLTALFEGNASGRLKVDAGELSVQIPSEEATVVDARARVGDVSLRGFPHQGAFAERRMLVGARYNGRLGPPEGDPTNLDLRVTEGAIDIAGM